jgi:hypothetical protein
MSARTAFRRRLVVVGMAVSAVATVPLPIAHADAPATLDAPAVTVVSQGFEELTVTATEGGTAPVTNFDVTYVRADTGASGDLDIVLPAGSRSGSLRLTQLDDNRPYTVTVVAVDDTTNPFTMSPSSQPITVTPITEPSAVRGVRTTYTNGIARVRWSRPRHDGRSPVTRYMVTLGCGHRRPHNRTALAPTRLAVFPGIRAGQLCSVSVKPFNTYVGGFSKDATMFTNVGLVTSLSRSGHGRWRFVTAGRWHSLGGPKLATAPSVSVDMHRHYYFLGGTSQGRLYIRTLTRTWRRLDSPACFRPALALVPPTYFDIGCRSAQGTLMYTDTSTVSHGRLVPAGVLPWTDTGRHIIGGVSAGQAGLSGEFAVRTAPRDAAGHNVSYYDTLDQRWRPTRLTCDATPAVSGLAGDFFPSFGCRHGRRSVQWQTTTGTAGTHVHTVTTPMTVGRTVGLATFFRGLSSQLAVTGRDGRIHVLDLQQRTWSSVARTAQRSIYYYPFSSSGDFGNIIVTFTG